MLNSLAMKKSRQEKPFNLIYSISVSYLIGLFSWFFLYLIFGDGNGFLGLVNALALYFFIPMPILAFIVFSNNFQKLVIPLLAALAIFVYLWGPLFYSPKSNISDPKISLRVMTFNVLGRAGSNEPILKTILEENADVIFLQELTHEIAALISLRMVDEYPFQILQPGLRSRGLGVISRYPLQKLDVLIPGSWMGNPQILEMKMEGEVMTLVNFHTISTGNIWPRRVIETFAARERDLESLADFARAQQEIGPLILAGDANITRINEAYKILADVLEDAWLQGGFGFDHTFPGPYEEGSSFAQISFFRVPYWLVGIDFIFYSNDFEATDTWLGVFYGGSDHRSIVSEISLKQSSE